MIANRHIVVPILLISVILFAMCSRPTTIILADKNELVRLAVIEVDASQIKAYNGFLREEIEASIRLEAFTVAL